MGSRRRGAILVAPAVSPPPRGVAALEDYFRFNAALPAVTAVNVADQKIPLRP